MQTINPTITVQTTIHQPIEKVWKLWTTAADIKQWNNPWDNWHSPHVENDFKEGGNFLFRMETKDGSAGFDYTGKYDTIIPHQLIELTEASGRKTSIEFISNGSKTTVLETFEPAPEPSIDMQKEFCEAVVNNFKRYAESQP